MLSAQVLGTKKGKGRPSSSASSSVDGENLSSRFLFPLPPKDVRTVGCGGGNGGKDDDDEGEKRALGEKRRKGQ